MDTDKYQEIVARTLLKEPGFIPTPQQLMMDWNSNGLAGEAGEILGVIKKWVYHRHPLDKEKLRKEIGDAVWYAAALCNTMNWSLGDILEENNQKLLKRYPNGFNTEDSIRRVDENVGSHPVPDEPMDNEWKDVLLPAKPFRPLPCIAVAGRSLSNDEGVNVMLFTEEDLNLIASNAPAFKKLKADLDTKINRILDAFEYMKNGGIFNANLSEEKMEQISSDAHEMSEIYGKHRGEGFDLSNRTARFEFMKKVLEEP